MPTIPFLPYSILMGNLGILCLGLMVYWSQHWLGGLAWDGSHKMFNWHPVLMMTGMVVLYGTGKWKNTSFSVLSPSFWCVCGNSARALHLALMISPLFPCSSTSLPFALFPYGFQAPLEGAACNTCFDSIYLCHSGIGGCLQVSQCAEDPQHVFST